ncbi:uncharacterized protein LOC128268413 [Anopheles cruzii]|uniref:uncharacterized protein LOC128268413 n=1 Tax=Anopheles cruzii TaxID=68878 RepID=UPI0022EC6C06|nr:uncharacterized protein LOC128268413 [Anopheles cruzii]
MASFLVKISLALLAVGLVTFGVAARASASDDLRGESNLVHRVVRSPQQQQPHGLANFPPPQFPFANPEIVSQDTQRDRNGFAQTTIYKYPNGMGSSAVSTSYSGTAQITGSLPAVLLGAVALVLWKLFH